MAKHLIVCGHGQNDPGAVGNGTTEREFTRNKLKPAMEKWAKSLKSNSIDFYNTSLDMFQQTNAGGGAYSVNGYHSVTEFHLDAASAAATGGHVIVSSSFKPDSFDLAIAQVVKKHVGWWGSIVANQGISYRNNLLNLNVFAKRGINYRLVELGFITNSTDMSKINSNLDAIAKELVESITGEKIGGEAVTPAPNTPTDPCAAGQNFPVQTDSNKSKGHVDRFGPKGDKLWVNGWQIGNYAYQFVFIMDRRTGKELARVKAPGIERKDVNAAYKTSGKVGYDVKFNLNQFKGKQVYAMMRCTNNAEGNTTGGSSDIHWKNWYHDIN